MISKPQIVRTPEDRIRILLADVHAVVRWGVSNMLNLYSDIEVIGEASDGEAAVRMSLKPDAILMNINIGFLYQPVIVSKFPSLKVACL